VSLCKYEKIKNSPNIIFSCFDKSEISESFSIDANPLKDRPNSQEISLDFFDVSKYQNSEEEEEYGFHRQHPFPSLAGALLSAMGSFFEDL